MARAFRVYYPALPLVAEHAPHRSVYVGDADGRCQVFAWDRAAGTARQVTDRAAGTTRAAVDPGGTVVWWFDDDLTGIGTWQVSDFDQPEHPRPALPGLGPARPAGLAMAADGTALVGLADADGVALYRRAASGGVEPVARMSGYAHLVDVDPTGQLLVVGRDAASPEAVTVLTTGGDPVAVLPAGPDRRLWPLGFAPVPDPAHLLLVVEESGEYGLASWTRADGLTRHPGRFDTEITAGWYPDGTRVLVRQDRHAGSHLHRVDLATGTRTAVPTPAGSILDAAVWPDGDIAYVWTDSATPPQIRSVAGVELPAGPDDGPADGAVSLAEYCRRTEVWVPGPAGDIHALVAAPADRAGPLPAVFLVHGGPFQHARDAYDPLVEVLVRTGCAVVRVNYRGSSGYGAAWRNDFRAGVGLTQLEDLAAVRAHLCEQGVIAERRVALWGSSWGGYLTLLALGRQPDLWRLGVAVNPVADYVAAFAAATPAIRALDTTLFGGTPDEVPQRYAEASPVSYVDQVSVPVFLAVATDDVRCPPAPVERYAGALLRRRIPVKLLRTRAGHEDFDARGHIALMQAVLLFMQQHFDGVRDEGTSVALAMARPAD
ncbi:S9 family peptidase [Micromonospora cathayae]|uniref:Prolyl oligopeptidase family serine peptidase n=1 Tax=Micromonospora cathayae TaxID=3028804 RepID=A0ABY7ZIE3_9ACTN|nr:prolyl oligopeptidase family serine peptidase [Micromonospora sp. HUAS 3]WDZ82720.1 prolyl oligopeptidase family serine peptidase [Micromonospora sp. HUAS 3]